ncbi:MAG: flagellar protein FliS [Pirellulales bacterium]|nr:flagellar protein FliS [Pirellulales bacterium]
MSTASQPELQLMLLEGALRFGRQAEQLWNAADQRAECDALLARTIDILEELVRGATLGTTEPSKRLEAEYAFAFRQLALAQLNHDSTPLEAALKLLDFQRETWKLSCDKLRAEAPAARMPHLQLEASLLSGSSLSLQG